MVTISLALTNDGLVSSYAESGNSSDRLAWMSHSLEANPWTERRPYSPDSIAFFTNVAAATNASVAELCVPALAR